jgi:hypothetical protein
MIYVFFAGVLKLILAEMAVLYAVLVLSILRSEGPHFKLRFDLRDPAHSSQRFLVWLGVRTAGAIVPVLKASLDILEDTSADVGEWVLHRRSS